jgi:hypothetical protein
MRELQKMANAGAIAFYLLLGDVPGREDIALRLAAVNDVLEPALKRPPTGNFTHLVSADFYGKATSLNSNFSLPLSTEMEGPVTLLGELQEFESAVRAEASRLAREGLLTNVDYLASEAVACRCNALGLGALMQSRKAPALATLLLSLRLYVCAGVIEDGVAGVERVRDMFSLSLRGLAPIQHDGSNWLVERLPN